MALAPSTVHIIPDLLQRSSAESVGSPCTLLNRVPEGAAPPLPLTPRWGVSRPIDQAKREPRNSTPLKGSSPRKMPVGYHDVESAQTVSGDDARFEILVGGG